VKLGTSYLLIAGRERRNQMKSPCYKVIVILVLGTLIFGCSPKMAIRQEDIKTKHNILLVPFKAPPVAITGFGAGTVILGGIVGAALVDAGTKEGREKVVDTLNKSSGQWEPIRVIAEECLDLIKKDTPFQIESISIVETRVMPGLENVQTKESKVFTAESIIHAAGSPWMRAGNKMLKNSNYLQYRKEYPESSAGWALEVFSTNMVMWKMKKMEFNVFLKLVEISSGEKIALDYTYDTFGMSLPKDVQNFRLFEDEFRSAARQLCGRVLGKMGLIRIQ
jgi:hypothetical protein